MLSQIYVDREPAAVRSAPGRGRAEGWVYRTFRRKSKDCGGSVALALQSLRQFDREVRPFPDMACRLGLVASLGAQPVELGQEHVEVLGHELLPKRRIRPGVLQVVLGCDRYFWHLWHLGHRQALRCRPVLPVGGCRRVREDQRAEKLPVKLPVWLPPP